MPLTFANIVWMIFVILIMAVFIVTALVGNSKDGNPEDEE